MSDIAVLSRTQRIIVNSNKSISIINAGPPGPRGLPGAQGIPGSSTNLITSVNGRIGDVIGLAEDTTVIHNTGNETISGVKIFENEIQATDITVGGVAVALVPDIIALDSRVDVLEASGGGGLTEPIILTQTAEFQAGFINGGHSAIGATAVVDPIWFGTETNALLNLKETFNGTFNTGQRVGKIIDIELDPNVHGYPTGPVGTSSWSQLSSIHSKNGNDKDIYEINAGYFRAEHGGDGIVTMLAAIEGRVWSTGNGIVNDMYGGWFVVVNPSGHVDRAYGVSIDRPFAISDIDNLYGLVIQDQSGLGNVRSENFRSQGVSSLNVFEGSVTIDGTLTVNGELVGGGSTGDFLSLSGGQLSGALDIFSSDVLKSALTIRHPTDLDSFPEIQAITGGDGAWDYGRTQLTFSLVNPEASTPVRKLIGFAAEGYYHDGSSAPDNQLDYPAVSFYEYITDPNVASYIFSLAAELNHSRLPFKVGGFASVDVSAMLSVESTTSGFLPPRMTEAQRDAIASPALGLMIYNITTDKINRRGASGWKEMVDA